MIRPVGAPEGSGACRTHTIRGGSLFMLLRRIGRVLAAVSMCLVGLPTATTLATPAGPCGGGAASFSAGVYFCTYTAIGPDVFTVPGTVTGITVTAIGGKGGDGYY